MYQHGLTANCIPTDIGLPPPFLPHYPSKPIFPVSGCNTCSRSTPVRFLCKCASVSPHYLHFLFSSASWIYNSNCPSANAPQSTPNSSSCKCQSSLFALLVFLSKLCKCQSSLFALLVFLSKLDMQVQVSVLTICTSCFPQQVGYITPTAHPQTLRNPRQTHRRFRPQPAGQRDLVLIAFAPPCQFVFSPVRYKTPIPPSRRQRKSANSED